MLKQFEIWKGNSIRMTYFDSSVCATCIFMAYQGRFKAISASFINFTDFLSLYHSYKLFYLRTFALIVCAQRNCAGNATIICHALLRALVKLRFENLCRNRGR